MKILVVGLGVIGATHGYLFQKAGHEVEHLLRDTSPKRGIKYLSVDLLDGRIDRQGQAIKDTYRINPCSQRKYDFIFVSVSRGQVKKVIEDLDRLAITGSLVLACGIWEDRTKLEQWLSQRDYLLGYPVAGGNMIGNRLTCCVFDHFMLESEEKSRIPNYQDLVKLFNSCQIKLEFPYDMLEWIWLHMAINAGVISVAGCYADSENPSAAAETVMNSARLLSQVIKSIRETAQIVENRGVDLRHYRTELLPYHLPIWLSAPLMKRMFAKNLLSRKIMTLHSNLPDLLFICQKLYKLGQERQVEAPNFYRAFQVCLEKWYN